MRTPPSLLVLPALLPAFLPALLPPLLLAASAGAAAAAKRRGADGAAPAGPALRIEVDKSKIDLKEHRLELKMSRQPGKVSIRVEGDSGATLAEEEQDFSGRAPGSPLIVSWTPSSDETAARIELKATDAFGYYTGVEITNWFVPIEHDEVNFKSGSAEIEAAEVPKLDAAYAVMVGKIAKIREGDKNHAKQNLSLYIGGHTDTVGGSDNNLKLSRERARAIASWLRRRGLTLPILFEGFGETALSVSTADEVDERRNRRVDYLLKDSEPLIKTTGFRPTWKRIN